MKSVRKKKSKAKMNRQLVISLPRLNLCGIHSSKPDEMFKLLNSLRLKKADKEILLRHCNTNSISKTKTDNGIQSCETVTTRNVLTVSLQKINIPLLSSRTVSENKKLKNMLIDLENLPTDMVNEKRNKKKMKNTLMYISSSPTDESENIIIPSECRNKKKRIRRNSFIDTICYKIPADFKDRKFEVKLCPVNLMKINMREPFYRSAIENKFIEAMSETEETFENRKRKIHKNMKLQSLLKNDFCAKDTKLEISATEVRMESYTEIGNETEIVNTGNSVRKRHRKDSSPVSNPPLKRPRGRPRKVKVKTNEFSNLQISYNQRPVRQCRLRNTKDKETARYNVQSENGCSSLISVPKTKKNCSQTSETTAVRLNMKNRCVDQLRTRSQKSKKLNVSFRTPELDDEKAKPIVSSEAILSHLDVPVSSTPCPKKSGGNFVALEMSFEEKSDRKTSSSCKRASLKNTFIGFRRKDAKKAQSAFSAISTDVCSSPVRSQKRMTRKEAQKKTDSVNRSKKIMEDNWKNIRFSERLVMKKLNVSIPVLPEKKEICSREEIRCVDEFRTKKNPTTPYILLNKLNNADVSSYKITPLREERIPSKAKTADDYGIDDVNTDDSTDDEEFPKKVIPRWAKEDARNNNNFVLLRKVVSRWMKPPKFRTSLIKQFFK